MCTFYAVVSLHKTNSPNTMSAWLWKVQWNIQICRHVLIRLITMVIMMNAKMPSIFEITQKTCRCVNSTAIHIFPLFHSNVKQNLKSQMSIVFVSLCPWDVNKIWIFKRLRPKSWTKNHTRFAFKCWSIYV